MADLKKLRNKKGVDEIAEGATITRKGRIMSCTNCGDTYHNIKTCERAPIVNPNIAQHISILSLNVL